MPVLKHAKKKLRQDKARTLKNKKQREQYRDLVKDARKKPTEKSVSAAFQAIDKAAKNNLIHKNKAARLKSSLSKLMGGGKKVSPAPKTEKGKTPEVKGEKKAKVTKSKASTKKSTAKLAKK